jgi:integration host factor subunit alpha
MTKADIISETYDKAGVSLQDAAEIVEMTIDSIKQTLKKGEDVKLTGFGNFMVRQKRTRRGRNPKTGQDLEIAPRKVVSFKASMLLKQHVLVSKIDAASVTTTDSPSADTGSRSSRATEEVKSRGLSI